MDLKSEINFKHKHNGTQLTILIKIVNNKRNAINNIIFTNLK